MKRVLSIIASLLLTLTAAWATPSGNWTDYCAENYKSIETEGNLVTIHIETAEQLAKFAKEYRYSYSSHHCYVYLEADINLSAHYWEPINDFKNLAETYELVFMGQGHKITGMIIQGQPAYAGLFGHALYLTVQDLTISNAQIDGGDAKYAGFVAGSIENGRMSNCTVENSILTMGSSGNTNNSYGGGLVGELYITAPYSTTGFSRNKVVNTQLTEQSGQGAIGGLFGSAKCLKMVPVTDCHANVEITCHPRSEGKSAVAGGLLGDLRSDTGNEKEVTFSYCSSSGTMTTYESSGGLIGRNSSMVSIEYCVSSVSIECQCQQDVSCGGLVGNTSASSSTNIINSFSSSYLYSSGNATLGGLVGSARASTCNLTNSTFAGTIFGTMRFGGAIVGYIPSDVAALIKSEHCFNDVVYDRSLCGLPPVGTADGFAEDEITSKKSKELASDEEPYNSLLMAPIDVRTEYEKNNSGFYPKMCYEDNIMLAAIPFYVKDPLHSYFCAWQVTTVSELIPIAYNRSTKKALGMYDLVNAPNGAAYETFLKLEEDAESAEKTITPFDAGEADVVVTYYNEETKNSLQRKVHLVVTYGVPWNDNEPADFPGGNGAAGDPYLIQNATQLLAVAANKEVYNRSDMYYRLTNDIFINTNLIQTDETVKDGAKVWTPVEWHANLDGSGNSIYGVYIKSYIENVRIEKPGTSATPTIYHKEYNLSGLFSILSGYVHDLSIVDSYLSLNSSDGDGIFSGLLCGLMTGEAKIERCMAHGIVDNNNYSAGIVGHATDIDGYESTRLNRSATNPYMVDCGTVEDCFACVHVEYGLEYFHQTGIKKDALKTSTGSGIAGNGVKQINRCVFTGKVENFKNRRGIGPKSDDIGSDISTWYFDKQQMTTASQTTNDRGEHTTAEMIGGDIFAGSSVWQHEKGRYPMLKQFANTPYGDILSMPVHFADDERAGNVTKVFEFPTENVTWTAVKGDAVVDVINECGGASPMSTGSDYIYARTNESVSQCTKALRVMQVDCTVTGTVGIDFKDANCKAAWLTAFGKQSTDVVTLRNAVTLKSNYLDSESDGDIISTFNSQAKTRGVTAFPEMRFFTGIKVLKPGMLSDLSALTELELPRQLTDIGPGVFSGCSSLESVTIPATTTTIEPGVLDDSSIKDIYVDAKNTSFEVRNHALFTTDEDLCLKAYPPARGEQSITLHGPFHNIATHAFYQIPQLDKIYIDYPKPEGSVVQMDDDAIVHYNYDTDGQLMDIYINDGSYDGTQWTATQYATGGNNDGILMKEYLDKYYWQEYASAGKLHRYFPLTVTAAKWATMYIGFCTKLPDNMKAYVVPEEVTSTTTSLTLKRINNRLHHTVPVVIYCEDPGTYLLSPEPGMSSADDVPMTANKLQGTDIGQDGKYGLAVNQSEIQNEFSILTLSIGKTSGEVGFYGFPGTYIPPYKAYLTCNWVGSNSPAFSVIIDDTIDTTTAIQDAGASLTCHPSQPEWYSLDGRRIQTSNLKKGIYINNGRKVVIK